MHPNDATAKGNNQQPQYCFLDTHTSFEMVNNSRKLIDYTKARGEGQGINSYTTTAMSASIARRDQPKATCSLHDSFDTLSISDDDDARIDFFLKIPNRRGERRSSVTAVSPGSGEAAQSIDDLRETLNRKRSSYRKTPMKSDLIGRIASSPTKSDLIGNMVSSPRECEEKVKSRNRRAQRANKGTGGLDRQDKDALGQILRGIHSDSGEEAEYTPRRSSTDDALRLSKRKLRSSIIRRSIESIARDASNANQND